MLFDNCVNDDALNKLDKKQLDAILKIFTKNDFYIVTCDNWEAYEAAGVLDCRFKTWRGAARAIYKAVRTIQEPVVFSVYRDNKSWGYSKQLIRRYTFK